MASMTILIAAGGCGCVGVRACVKVCTSSLHYGPCSTTERNRYDPAWAAKKTYTGSAVRQPETWDELSSMPVVTVTPMHTGASTPAVHQEQPFPDHYTHTAPPPPLLCLSACLSPDLHTNQERDNLIKDLEKIKQKVYTSKPDSYYAAANCLCFATEKNQSFKRSI